MKLSQIQIDNTKDFVDNVILNIPFENINDMILEYLNTFTNSKTRKIISMFLNSLFLNVIVNRLDILPYDANNKALSARKIIYDLNLKVT